MGGHRDGIIVFAQDFRQTLAALAPPWRRRALNRIG